MKDLYVYLSESKIYVLSIGFSTIFTTIYNYLISDTPKEIFGVSVSLWLIALILNLFDIQSGIRADKVRSKKLNEEFRFKSGKGWRAFEKIFIFSMFIWFVNTFQQESIKNNFPDFVATMFTFAKFVGFFYVSLLEFQSIGENREDIYGKKEKAFHLLDKLLVIMDDGILDKFKNIFK